MKRQRRSRTWMATWALALCAGVLGTWGLANLESGGIAAADTGGPHGLSAVGPEGESLGKCPLEHTDVDVEIAGSIARVTLTQRFANPFDEPIEAVYTFPMSERAAVDRMVMRIGDRTIKGVVKEREEARRVYEEAKARGQAASLLDQERPNIFTQSVANIMPGDEIRITISYVEYLEYEDGEYAYSFPMVVGPRYIPGNPMDPSPQPRRNQTELGEKAGPDATEQVPDAAKINPPITPKGTRAGHDISLQVRLDAGVPVHALESKLHEVTIERPSETKAVVSLKDQAEIPNRDFVITYQVAGDEIEDAVLVHNGEKGSYFTLIMQPPKRVEPDEVTPKELYFVIDSSGSMSGFPIEKAKKTMRMCIEQLNPNDTFNLVSFSGGVGYCFPKPVPNTLANRQRALEYLSQLRGSGGTEMMKAIHAALGGQPDPERLRVVCFMTDGYIGNDMAILDEIKKNAGQTRVFSFGIGNSVNRFLIEGMADMGRGAAEVVTLESESDEASERFYERVHAPLLTDVRVRFEGLAAKDDYPDIEAIPDLFSGKPLMVTGRFNSPGDGAIVIEGKTASGDFQRRIPVTFPEQSSQNDVLAALWARERVDWLMQQDWLGHQTRNPDASIKDSIIDVGLKYNLVTQYTSFVAVEERVINEDGQSKTVEVPAEMPDGVSYEGIFGPQAGERAAMAHGQAAVGQAPGKMGLSYNSGGFGGGGVSSDSARNLSGIRRSTERMKALPPSASEPAPMVQDEAAMEPKGETRQLNERPEEAERDDEANSKLHPAFRNIENKLANGNYRSELVTVTNGWVQVIIELEEDTPQRINELEELGVSIQSHARSGKKVLARVKVEALEKLAALDFVKHIRPPAA